jgi:hypothetical protein
MFLGYAWLSGLGCAAAARPTQRQLQKTARHSEYAGNSGETFDNAIVGDYWADHC